MGDHEARRQPAGEVSLSARQPLSSALASPRMDLIRRTIDLDSATDERLRRLAAQRGRSEAGVIAEALAQFDRTHLWHRGGVSGLMQAAYRFSHEPFLNIDVKAGRASKPQ